GRGVVPDLATGYQVSPDGKTVSLPLRDGVKFSDGSPVLPSDVKWSLDRARNPKNGPWNSLLASVDSVETQGSTVVLHLKQPDPVIVPVLATFNTAILPEKLFMGQPGDTDEEKSKGFSQKPVGAGPFMLSEWQRNDHMILKPNPYYWAKGEDGKTLPYLDAVRFEIIPDDATRILKLQSGGIDGAELIPFARVAELKADPKLAMMLYPSTHVQYLTFNVRDKLKDGTANPLSNEKVRQALNYAVDKNAIIQAVTRNIGKPMQSFMSSVTPLFYGAGPAYPFDMAKAKQLMKDAGYDRGFDLTVLAVAGNADQAGISTIVQQFWSQLGVRLKIEQLDNATLTAKYRAEDFQIRNAAWTDDIADPSEIASYFVDYSNIHSLHGGFDDPRVQTLYKQSQVETDPAKRAADYKEIQQIYMTAAPILFLYETPYPVALAKQVQDFNQIPLGNNIFVGAYLQK
ncbi:MAG: ABC transporter substrate-binding protein, partial [Acetobacteraceae bacterium]|nr:ABC transporter substrate-binding protein [Acetobacteraceae bacterium]